MHKPTNAEEEMHFIAFLVEALPIVDAETPTLVNDGGCGVFAQLLSDKLAEMDVEHQIVAIFPRKKERPDADDRKLIANFNNFRNHTGAIDLKNSIPHHIVIRIGELYFDSTGVVNVEVLFARKDVYPLTREQLDELVSDAGGWNSLFDRDCIPGIKQHLDEVFARYDEFHSGAFGTPTVRIEPTDKTRAAMKEQAKRDNPLVALASMFS